MGSQCWRFLTACYARAPIWVTYTGDLSLQPPCQVPARLLSPKGELSHKQPDWFQRPGTVAPVLYRCPLGTLPSGGSCSVSALPLPLRMRPRLFSTRGLPGTACWVTRCLSVSSRVARGPPRAMHRFPAPDPAWPGPMTVSPPRAGQLCHWPRVPRVQLRTWHSARAHPACGEWMMGPLVKVGTRCFSSWSPRSQPPGLGQKLSRARSQMTF